MLPNNGTKSNIHGVMGEDVNSHQYSQKTSKKIK
jgi:hypothetical protein